MQPDLKLSYNNQSREEGVIFGAGWSINIPYIERINRKGVDKLYSENYFSSSLSGELLFINENEWGAKTEDGSYIKYTYSNNSWTAKDKNGVTYKFGITSACRQDDPSDGTKVYRWMLEEVRDTNDNYIRYEYFKDSGQIYPSRIVYTGNGSADGIFEVILSRETRQDKTALHKTGFGVISNYRVKEIDIKTSNILTRRYVLSYVNGANSLRSLLDSVTESGIDELNVTTTLPLTDFNYESQPDGWTADTSFTVNSSILDYQKRASHFLDVNGDGLLDVLNNGYIFNSFGGFGIESVVYLNNGSGWILDTSWTVDPSQLDLQNSATRFVDVNGDGLVDILNSGKVYNDVNYGTYVLENAVYLNNGHGWTRDASWTVDPSIFDTKNNNTRILDINGDGLVDVLNKGQICYYTVRGDRCNQQVTHYAVYLNNGHGWTDGLWNVDSSMFQTIDFRFALHTVDVNGDGLPDIINTGRTRYAEDGYETLVFINTGHGWAKDSSWNTNPALLDQRNLATHLLDVNGDGLADIVNSGRVVYYDQYMVFHDTYETAVYLNNGNSWEKDTSWNFEYSMFDASNASTNIGDYDGDGLTDVISYGYYSYYGADMLLHTIVNYAAYKNVGFRPDSLKEIQNSKGGSTSVLYKAASQYKRNGIFLNPNISFPLETVNKITNNDGMGNSFYLQYEYEGGKYYFNEPFDRKFAGFGKITATDDEGNKTINYYHQGNDTDSSHGEYDDHISKAGKIYRTEKTDDSGNIYSKNINKWDRYDLGNGRSFVKQIQQLNMSYDGDSAHKDSAETYAYDNATGNLAGKFQWGEIEAGDDGTYTDMEEYDNLTTTFDYASNSQANIYGLPSDITVTNYADEKLKEDRYYYDSMDLGEVEKGNETMHERWVWDADYIATGKTYNSYGLVITETDARDNSTSYAYDSYNLYPVSVTNALDHTTSYLYDYSSGQVKQKTDPNGRVFQYVYDGLDRITAEKQPDLANPSTLVNKTAYIYTDTSGAVSVQKTDYLDGSNIVNSYTYYDGLGRKIQERKQAEGSNYKVKDYSYNNLDLLEKESLPYFSAGSSKTAATTDDALYTEYAYDPLYRVLTATDATGTISNHYYPWETDVTDKNGNYKEYYKDAYGRLVGVNEYVSGNYNYTGYDYDGMNNLIKIIDVNGNVRYFTYNGLGKLWSAEDLHDPDDETFGTWYYDYDANGNLTYRSDPNGQRVYIEYDELNRVKIENYAGAEGNEVYYGYDEETDGIGRWTSVATGHYSQSIGYDPLGNVIFESKYADPDTYATYYTYDRQGNRLTVANPDDSVIKYEYGTGGLLNSVSRKESTDSSYTYVVSNIDYSPMEQPTAIAYANGMSTANTYDASELYRLRSKVTTIAGSVHGQDLYYAYDNNGNITQIVDDSGTDSAKTVDYTYDELNRLTSATAADVAQGQSAYTENYTYDAIGNLTSKTGQGNYSYAGNQGTSYTNPHAVTSIGSTNLTYDNNGNLLTKGSELSNTWDYNNRLIQSIAGAATNTYTYDVSGQRLTLSDGETVRFYASKYFNTDGTNPTKHIFANDIEIAAITGTGASATVHYTATDHLTGSNLTTNSSNNQEELLDYMPFGTIRIDQRAEEYSDQRKYAGHEFDNDTGLSYMDARYYDGAIGRFLSQDPAFLAVGNSAELKEKTKMELERYLSDPQLANSYSYVANNPLKYIDSTGDFLDIALDVGFIGYDLYKMGSAVWNGNWSEAKSESVNLGLDVGGAVLPGITGLGVIRRTGEAARVADRANDARRASESVNLSSREILSSWRNTTMDSTYKTVKYHFEKHGFGRTLSQYTKDGTNFYNTYKNRAIETMLGNGEIGLKIKVPEANYYGIYDKAGKQVTHGPIRENRSFLHYNRR